MALTLNARKGTDTLKKLEAAVTRRHAEAISLAPTEPLGAIYLFGYTIEIRLKCAYYRLEGIPIEILRYRANRPYDKESEAVADAAQWLRKNYRRLWS